MNKLSYGYGAPKLPSHQFKISPSSASGFFGYRSSWFTQQFLEENKFLGSNASVRGTALHWLAFCYQNTKQITDSDIQELDDYIDIQVNDQSIDISEPLVKADLDNMWDLLRTWIDNHPLDSAEEYITTELSPSVVLSGQVDYIRTSTEDIITDQSMNLGGGTIIPAGSLIVGDYKSTGSKLMPKSPSYDHIFQAQVYATILQLEGTNVDAIEINYIKGNVPGAISEKTGKTGKAYPTEQKTFTIPFTRDDFEKKHGQMMNISDTMNHFFSHPELSHILFGNQLYKGRTFDVSAYQGTTEVLF